MKNVAEIHGIYTGGTTDMSIGMWEAFQDLRSKGYTIDLHAKHPNRIYRPLARESRFLTGGRNHIGLESYLAAFGLRMFAPEAIAEGEKRARNRRGDVEAIADAVFAGRDQGLIDDRVGLLNGLAGAANKDVAVSRLIERTPAARADLDTFVAALAEAVASLEGLSFSKVHGAWRFETRDVATGHLLTNGRWFEEWIWHRIREELVGTPAEVRLGVGVCSLDAVGSQDFDLDVAVFANDQLNNIEAKSGADIVSDMIDRQARRKYSLVGPYGQTWLCAAQDQSSRGKVKEFGERLNIRVEDGFAKVDALLAGARSMVA